MYHNMVEQTLNYMSNFKRVFPYPDLKIFLNCSSTHETFIFPYSSLYKLSGNPLPVAILCFLLRKGEWMNLPHAPLHLLPPPNKPFLFWFPPRFITSPFRYPRSTCGTSNYDSFPCAPLALQHSWVPLTPSTSYSYSSCSLSYPPFPLSSKPNK